MIIRQGHVRKKSAKFSWVARVFNHKWLGDVLGPYDLAYQELLSHCDLSEGQRKGKGAMSTLVARI